MNTNLDRLKVIENTEIGYKGVNYKVTEVKLVNTLFVVKTNKKTFNFTENEIDTFLSEIHAPIQSDKSVKQNEVAITQSKVEIFKPLGHNEEIKNTLIDTLRQLKDKKATPEEANAICNVVNQFVNLQKNEIQVIALLNKA